MSHDYDDTNIFARILRGEIPCDKVLETEYCLAFRDIAPQAPVHVLVVPKGPYVDAEDFGTNASVEEQADFVRAVAAVAREAGVARSVGGNGFRTITNAGPDGVQEVPHYHLHVLGGRVLGRMLKRFED